MDLNGEGNHAPHAVGEAGHGLAHPLGVADDHQLGALQPVLVAQQGILEPHATCNTAPLLTPAALLNASRACGCARVKVAHITVHNCSSKGLALCR